MLGIVACHFNPCGYKKNVENYHRFRDALKKPVTVVELSFNGEFIEPDAIQVQGDIRKNCLWQKERLLNLAIGQLPEAVTRVAWIDADLIFANPDMIQQAEELLEEHDVVQLCEKFHHTDRDGRVIRSLETEGWKAQNRPDDRSYHHPGGCWAANRSVIKNGLYDRDIIGGADTSLVRLWSGDPEKRYIGSHKTPKLEADYLAWAAGQPKLNIGYVPGDALHMWHGDTDQRAYRQRFAILANGGFDPETDIFVNDAGIWEWSETEERRKIQMQNGMRKYFIKRREDG